MGHRTRAAVKVFQKDYGLTITGYVDKKTWEELNRVYEKKFSLKNADTTLIQTALKKQALTPGLLTVSWV